jgi:hypothetical protein
MASSGSQLIADLLVRGIIDHDDAEAMITMPPIGWSSRRID